MKDRNHSEDLGENRRTNEMDVKGNKMGETSLLLLLLLLLLFYHVPYIYTDALEKLNLQNLRKRRQDLDALFLVHVYRGFKSCASLLGNTSLRVPPNSLRDFQLFGVCPSYKHCPSARCAYAAIAVGKDLDVFAVRDVSLRHIALN
jgi:hypothetical protein